MGGDDRMEHWVVDDGMEYWVVMMEWNIGR